MNTSKAWVSVCVLVIGLLAGTASAVNIATVPVGDPGNAADNTGFGSVGYSYNIGTYEVTAGQYAEFLNKVAYVDTYGLYSTYMSDTSWGCGITRSGSSGSFTYSVASDFVNRPVNWISWGDSARFSNWLHNGQPTGAQDGSTTEDGSYVLNGATSDAALLAVTRNANATWVIPSEDEWYKAAYYNGGSTNARYYDYPTSSDTAPGRDMADASGNNANYYTDSGAYPIDSGKYTTVVGEFKNSDSPSGTFDQGGNVFEWNEAVLSGSNRGLRGGSFRLHDGYLLASDRYGGGNGYPTSQNDTVGFRVSQVPEPCSALMVLVGAFGLALVRRRG
jgi:formylglycine-generating enzyme required for sulfatase activity